MKLLRNPLWAVAIGIGVGYLAAKFLVPSSTNGVSGLGVRAYPGVPADRYVGIQRSKAIMTALQGVHSRLGYSELPSSDIDPAWSRVPGWGGRHPSTSISLRSHATQPA
jgi:hypothetical protein